MDDPVPRSAAHPGKLVLGLIGGIGSGKSLVAAALARSGAKVISGDQLGHEALRQPDIKARVVERWTKAVLDEHGDIDRRRLGRIVFADPAERRALETLVFPRIEEGFRRGIEAAASDPAVKLVVLDAAILLEAGWHRMCDEVIYVHAPRVLRLKRLAQQRGWSAKEVQAREQAQLPLTEKVSRADYVVDNSGTPEQTVQQVEDLLRSWKLVP